MAVDVNAIGSGQARRISCHLGDVSEHPRGGGFAVGAGNARNGHTRRRARRKQHVDYRACHIARQALGRCHVHTKSGGGIDFTNATADLFITLCDVRTQKINAANVKADGGHGTHGHVAIVRMDHVSDVSCRAACGQIGGGTKHHHLPACGNRIWCHLHTCQHHVGLLVERQTRHYFFMANATARVFVNEFDQLPNGRCAIANHMAWCATGGGDQFTVHHQQAMVVAGKIGFNDHRR